MMETYSLAASQDPISGDYQQVLHWTVKDKPSRAILLQILAIPVFILLGFAFSILAIHYRKIARHPQVWHPGNRNMPGRYCGDHHSA